LTKYIITAYPCTRLTLVCFMAFLFCEVLSNFTFLEICSTGPQINKPGTVFYDEIVSTLFTDLCDAFTINLPLLPCHAEI
jgi:hypothetical protein